MARNLPIHSTAAMKTAAAAEFSEFSAFVGVVFHVGQQKTKNKTMKGEKKVKNKEKLFDLLDLCFCYCFS